MSPPPRFGTGVARVCGLVLVLSSVSCRQNSGAIAENHYIKAQAFVQERKTEAALIELTRAVQLSPGMSKAHHGLANLT